MLNDTVNRYVRRYAPQHPRANTQGYVYEHVLVVERALGRVLPDGAEVHHVNEIRSDNRNTNLVVCQDHAYHALLHQRLRAYRACGRTDWRACVFCAEYDDPASMTPIRRAKHKLDYYHKVCLANYRRQRKAA